MWGTMDDGGFGKSRFDQTGGGGGGFLNSTISSPSTSEKKKPDRITNVVPCTIAQILSMPDSEENLKIGSLSAKIITFVGCVKDSDVQTTKITYIMNDCTAPDIEVQMWIGESDEQNKKINVVSQNSYARVTGAVRSLKGKRHVIAFNIQPIKDINEITMHIAEVIHSSMSVAVMDKQNASTTGGFSTSVMTSGGMTESSMDTFDSAAGRKFSKPQQLVKQVIFNCKDEQGISVPEIYNALKTLSKQSIQEALDFLSNEGHIYTTIDDEHYKSTDSV